MHMNGMNVASMMAACGLALVGCTLFEAGPRPVRIDVAAGESLKVAQERVRALPAEERARGVEVVLADGDYFLPEGLPHWQDMPQGMNRRRMV